MKNMPRVLVVEDEPAVRGMAVETVAEATGRNFECLFKGVVQP